MAIQTRITSRRASNRRSHKSSKRSDRSITADPEFSETNGKNGCTRETVREESALSNNTPAVGESSSTSPPPPSRGRAMVDHARRTSCKSGNRNGGGSKVSEMAMSLEYDDADLVIHNRKQQPVVGVAIASVGGVDNAPYVGGDEEATPISANSCRMECQRAKADTIQSALQAVSSLNSSVDDPNIVRSRLRKAEERMRGIHLPGCSYWNEMDKVLYYSVKTKYDSKQLNDTRTEEEIDLKSNEYRKSGDETKRGHESASKGGLVCLVVYKIIVLVCSLVFMVLCAMMLLNMRDNSDGCSDNQCESGRCIVLNKYKYVCKCLTGYTGRMCCTEKRKYIIAKKCSIISLVNWMSDPKLGEIRIHKLAIPGSHNSFSYHPMKGSPIASDVTQRVHNNNNRSKATTNIRSRRFRRTQIADFARQLTMGVRYFELSITMRTTPNTGSEFKFGTEFIVELEKVVAFLSIHRSEVVFFNFRCATLDHALLMGRALGEVFGSSMVAETGHDVIRSEEGEKELSEATLTELRVAGKRVIVLYSLLGGHNLGRVGSGDSSSIKPSSFDTNSRRSEIHRCLPSGERRTTQLSLTRCSSSGSDYATLRHAPLRNRLDLRRVTRLVKDTWRQKGHKANVVSRDFVDEEFSRTIIALNSDSV